MVIGFIGLGSMASALVRGMAEMGSYAIDLRSMTQSRGSFTFHFVRYEDCPPAAQEKAIAEAKALAESCGLRLCASNREVLERSDVVVLAVKPQILEGVLEEIAPLAAGKLFLSVAAGK